MYTIRSLTLVALVTTACGVPTSTSPDVATPESPPTATATAPQWTGKWRAVLDSPGGELAFDLGLQDDDGNLNAVVFNGDERLPFTSVTADGRTLTLRIDNYDSDIVATLADDGNSMHGAWTKTAANGKSSLKFHAHKGDTPRYSCATAPTSPPSTARPVVSDPSVPAVVPPADTTSVDGLWDLHFTQDDGKSFVGRAELAHDPESGKLTGTVLTDTGDYRYLAGCYGDSGLILSVFDGAHAFLFRGKSQPDGALHGDFWSRDTYHASFQATRPNPNGESRLADPYDIVQVTSPDGRVRFAFPDTNGNIVRSDDPRFAGKVLILDIFGTWCPNCNDQAPMLASWHERYHQDGLEIVGLAYEYTGDPKRDAEYLTKYAERYRITYPLLLAGTSDKTDASATLPDLSHVAAYPTTIFIGRDGRVHRIYSGYFGPATGLLHAEMLAEHEEIIRGLLATPP